jgi:hypothetical protein
MSHTLSRPRLVAPLDRAFDNLKAAEEEAVRQIRTGHIFETDTIMLRERMSQFFIIPV